MITLMGKIIGESIAKGVISAIQDYQKRFQIENMQAEILEQWGNRILQAVKDGCIKAGVSKPGYETIAKRVEEVIKTEFDNTKI